MPRAQAGLDSFSGLLARQYPDSNAGRSFLLVPLREPQTGFTAPFLALFEAAAAFVLLIACANVAGLLIARGARREREMGLRSALGASRGRIVRQLLTEGLVLSMLGASGAVGIARVGRCLLPWCHRRAQPGRLDGRVSPGGAPSRAGGKGLASRAVPPAAGEP